MQLREANGHPPLETVPAHMESFGEQIQAAEDRQWAAHAESLLLNLSASPQEVFDYMLDSVEGGEMSPFRQMVLQWLIGVRSQMVSSLSNLLNAMRTAADAVIRNIR